MKLNNLARGTYFRFDNRLFLIIDHHQELADTIELTKDGLFVRSAKISENADVEIIGFNFYGIINYYEHNPER